MARLNTRTINFLKDGSKNKKLHNRILEILAFKTESAIYRTLTSSFTRPCGNKIFNWQEKKEKKRFRTAWGLHGTYPKHQKVQDTPYS